jgi:hypothetical protein
MVKYADSIAFCVQKQTYLKLKRVIFFIYSSELILYYPNLLLEMKAPNSGERGLMAKMM